MLMLLMTKVLNKIIYIYIIKDDKDDQKSRSELDNYFIDDFIP